MTITTVAINCDIGLANNSEFTASQLEFTLSEADYDTLLNDSIPAATVIVALNASGAGTANLWPVTRGTRNSFYTVVLVGSRTINGRVTSERFTLGRIAPPATGAPFALADLLAQSSGGIVVGSTVYATLAGAVAAALQAVTDAEAAAATAGAEAAATVAAAVAADAASAAASAAAAQTWTPAFAQEAVTAANALATASLGGSVSFTPLNLNPITLPSATWIITDLYASGLPQFSPDDWEQVGSTLTLKRAYHIGQRIDYRYRIAQTSMLSTSTFADGTAALPALAFTNNANMGLYRIGANILGFSVNATERMRLTTTGAQITGLLTGTAVTQSATDTTAGRLFKVGDFGLGSSIPPSVTDIDDFSLRAGWYRAVGTGIGTFPTFSGGSAVSTFGYLFVLTYSTAVSVQIYLPVGNAAGGGRMFYRVSTTGPAWLPWREMFSNLNILGTVSQSAGVPTSAIMQGNATQAAPTGGWTERLADGFQIVHHSLTSSAAGDSTWTYNSAFLAGTTPVVMVQPIGDSNLRVQVVSRSAIACVFSIRDGSGNRVAVPVDLIARGRWSNLT